MVRNPLVPAPGENNLPVVVFDEVFRSEGIYPVRTPITGPGANAFAERWIRTVRTECRDWLMVFSSRQLERVLRIYIRHYKPTATSPCAKPWSAGATRVREAPLSVGATVRRQDRLGGLLHAYYEDAA